MTKTTLLSIVASLVRLFSAGGQTFQNLGFESATIISIAGGGTFSEVQWNAAMPGWTGYHATIPLTSLHHNDWCLSPCTSIAIYDQPGFNFGNPLVGRYSVILGAGAGFAGGQYETSIAQTALIPSDAQSIRFLGVFDGTEPFKVSVAGQNLPLYALNPRPDFTVYGADISAFAGQTAEVRFTVATDADSARAGAGSRLLLDAISFSATPVPEPSVVVLLSLGAGIVALRLYLKTIKGARFCK